jgi:hypothetical protein
MSVKQNDKTIDTLTRHARERVKDIFKAHGLSSYRRVGLQKAFQKELVKVALSGEIDLRKETNINKGI